jgi:nucleotide-binding universal stress UspA family protein
MFKKILIATDGSDNAMRAAEIGKGIAACMGAEVTLVYAAYVPGMYANDLRPEIVEAIREDGRRILKITARVFEDSDVVLHKELLYDEKAEDGILRLVKEETYDLVIVGSRGLDATQRKALGSTSMRVLQGTVCPVLVVH